VFMGTKATHTEAGYVEGFEHPPSRDAGGEKGKHSVWRDQTPSEQGCRYDFRSIGHSESLMTPADQQEHPSIQWSTG
jgi:hypothetical protein